MSEYFFDASKDARSSRARRIMDGLLRGAGIDAIGEEEDLPVAMVDSIVREELARRQAPSIADFAKIQIARLERLCIRAVGRVEQGDLKAIDRALKILDRLDRYHGFTRASPAAHPYGDEERKRLLDKLNAIAARLKEDGGGE